MRKRTGRAKAEIFVANDSFSAEVKGENFVAIKGVTRVRKGHPVLRQLPDYFEPVQDEVHYDVEQATARPGPKRRRSAKKTPAKQKASTAKKAAAKPAEKAKEAAKEPGK